MFDIKDLTRGDKMKSKVFCAEVNFNLHHKEHRIAQRKRRIRQKGITSFFVANNGELVARTKIQSIESRMLRTLSS